MPVLELRVLFSHILITRLRSVLLSPSWNPQDHMASTHGTKNRRRNAGRQLTPLQFLLRLKDFLASKVVRIKHDYIILKVTSYKLLKLIHQDIKCKLAIDNPLYENQSEDEKSMYVLLVIEILKAAKEEECC
jgi:hypothetical protein